MYHSPHGIPAETYDVPRVEDLLEYVREGVALPSLLKPLWQQAEEAVKDKEGTLQVLFVPLLDCKCS